VIGSDWSDFLYGSAGANTLFGGFSDDVLFGRAANDKLFGGDGNDVLNGGAGRDVLDGGVGFDMADYSDSSAAVSIDMGTATLSGADAVGDRLVSIEGLTGSAFADTLTGDSGTNRLVGGSGADKLSGGTGDDVIEGGEGADTIDGGAGNDWASYEHAVSRVVVNLTSTVANPNAGDARGDILRGIENLEGSQFNDNLTGNSANNAISGGEGNDAITDNGGNDRLTGGNGDDTIKGGTGNDFLLGDAGNDTLQGGDGTDTLVGGFDSDTLTGGAGADVFAFSEVGDSAPESFDAITDFSVGQDKIDLSLIDASTLADGNQAFAIVSAFSGAGREIVMGRTGTTTTLFADVDGDTDADFVLIIDSAAALTATDFVL